MAGAGVWVRLLGPFEVSVAGVPVTLPVGRARTALAALALAADRPVGTDALVARVWGDQLPEHPVASLSSLITRVRRSVGAGVIGRSAAGYLLRTEPDRVDVLRFRRLVTEAAGLDDPDRVRGRLDEALELWRGRPFTGIGGAFERDEVPRLTEEWLGATERRIGMDLGTGDVVAELSELTARYPLRESLWRALIVALAGKGRQADALAAYQRLRVTLREELGVDPSPELQETYRRLLTGAAPTPVAPARRDRPGPPRQLPADVGGFTGRHAELAELDRILDDPQRPPGQPTIVAVDGPAGIGKTALAVHWCRRIADRCPDGALYVNLHGFGPADPVPPGAALDILLRALGTPTDRIGTQTHERAAELRTRLAGRRMLLLLDNARDVETVRPLLPGSDCVVVITSRDQLRGLAAREGARRVTVGQLDTGAALDLLAAALGGARVAAEPAAATELVTLCARLPLALRVSAERVGRYPEVPLGELVDELRDERGRLDSLSDDSDPSADPRAVFSWSYRALDDTAARAFRLLGLHPGADIGLNAAAALLDAPPATARRALDRLVAVHLLEQRRPGRYEAHDLLRVYAAELAAATDPLAATAAALDRLLDWYLRTSDAAHARFSTYRDPGLTLDPPAVAPLEFADDVAGTRWCDTECANLVAAARYAFEHGNDAFVTGVNRRLRDHFRLRSRWDDWQDVAGMALTLARRSGSAIDEWSALNSLGTMCLGQRRYGEALRYYQRCLAVLGPATDGREAAATWNDLGVAHMFDGHPDQAVPYYERALRTAWSETLPTLTNLGAAYGMLGRFEASLDVSRRAAELHGRLGHRLHESNAVCNMAEAMLHLHRYAEARDAAGRALVMSRRVESVRGQVEVLVILGRAHRGLGEAEPARAALREALDLLAATADDHWELAREAAGELAALGR